MTKPLNILTFNWHEPYICLLSRTGHNFIVVTPEMNNGVRNWDERMRPTPQNVMIVDPVKATEGLKNNSYDLVICNNVKDIVFIKDFPIPFIMVFHNRFKTEAGLSKNPPNLDEYKKQMKDLSSKGLRIFISESKKADWGYEGDVITPGIDIADYYDYIGDVEQAFVVGNLVKERDLMMGYSDQVELLDGLPNFLMGLNPTIPNSRISDRWDDLKDHFKRLRFYLNTTVNEYEDGYNLAMLEAMATGMPVVSTYNATSPIINGENGFISKDKEYLKEKIRELFQSPELAKRIGAKGRQTILEKFNINDFAEKWNRAIEKALDMGKRQIREMSEANDITSRESNQQPEEPLLQTFTSLKEAKDYEAIIAEFETITGSIPDDLKEKINLIGAEAYAMSGIFNKAKGLYQECLADNPSSCETLIGLGTLAIQGQNSEDAYNAFQRAIELDETNSKALCGNGISLIMQGFLPESKEFFVKALDSDIQNIVALNQLVTICHSLQNYTDAIQYLERYIALHQTALDYCYTLASLYFVSGEREKAHNEVEKILLFDPESQNALELLAKIEAGE